MPTDQAFISAPRVYLARWLALVAICLVGGWLVGANNLELTPPVVRAGSIVVASGVLIWALRSQTLMSPFVLMGVPLLAGLAAGTMQLTKIASDWTSGSLAEAVTLAVAPILGVVIAYFARVTSTRCVAAAVCLDQGTP